MGGYRSFLGGEGMFQMTQGPPKPCPGHAYILEVGRACVCVWRGGIVTRQSTRYRVSLKDEKGSVRSCWEEPASRGDSKCQGPKARSGTDRRAEQLGPSRCCGAVAWASSCVQGMST